MTELLDILRAVPIDALRSIDTATPDLIAGLDELAATGATIADVGLVAKDGGYQIVILPLEEDDEDEDDEAEEYVAEEYSDDDMDTGPTTGLAGLLDRLRAVFGKALSFQAENATISRNRKRAAARSPHEFVASVYATRKGVVRCRVCGGGMPADGLMCAGRMTKDYGSMTGYDLGMGDDMGDHEWPLGELTLRSASLAEAYCMIEDALGQWSQADAHYMDASPFVADGYACSNCVAYCAEMACCDWVAGDIAPDGLCKLNVIPDALRKATLEDVTKADTYTPTDGVMAEAQRALDWLAEGEAGDGFTDTGRARASALAAGRAVSLDTVQRMASYLARHEVDKQGEGFSPGEPGYPSPGRVAWAAWGGDPAISWTRSILDSVEKDGPSVESVHVDVPMVPGGGRKRKRPMEASTGIVGVFSKADAQRFTLGPWYVPDAYDAHGEWTDATELQMALWEYVRNADRSIMLQHDTSVMAGEWVEAMTWPYPVVVPMMQADGTIVDHEFPAGTVFMGVVWEPWAWELVQQGKIRGYSMGGRGQRVEVDLETEGV